MNAGVDSRTYEDMFEIVVMVRVQATDVTQFLGTLQLAGPSDYSISADENPNRYPAELRAFIDAMSAFACARTGRIAGS